MVLATKLFQKAVWEGFWCGLRCVAIPTNAQPLPSTALLVWPSLLERHTPQLMRNHSPPLKIIATSPTPHGPVAPSVHAPVAPFVRASVRALWRAWPQQVADILNAPPQRTQPVTTHACPITLEACVYPVVASDGHTYERDALMKHMALHGSVSPMTKETLDFGIYDNRAL